ncbi:hypothetical protein D3C86_2143190 [compost metagenome]
MVRGVNQAPQLHHGNTFALALLTFMAPVADRHVDSYGNDDKGDIGAEGGEVITQPPYI